MVATFAQTASEIESGAHQPSNGFSLHLYAGIYTTDTIEEEELPFMEMLNRASIALLVAKTAEESTFRFYTEDICEHALNFCN